MTTAWPVSSPARFALLLAAGCTMQAQRAVAPETARPAQPLAAAKAAPPAAPAPPVCTVTSAGPAPLRRLTREQYINTVTDLMSAAGVRSTGALAGLRGNSVVASTTLPADEMVGPFRSNLVAAPTELDAQQLMEASERAADVAAGQFARLLACDGPGIPAAAGDTATGAPTAPALAAATPIDDACARRFVDSFGMRAFRRPLRDAERERYARLFFAETRAGGAREGVRAVVRTLLQSPYFVHHPQQDGAAAQAGLVALGPHALAARLSYYLWVSGPDDGLLQAAADGRLGTPAGLRAETQRLLADDKAQRGIASFHAQWLGIEDVAATPKNGKLFPVWNRNRGASTSTLGRALRRETERFADHVIRKGDGKLDTLLTAPFSLLEEPLYDYYGVAPPAIADPDRPVALNPKQRAGVLTHGSFLAFHAHAAQGSPVARGVLVRKNLLCQDLPDPPPNVNNNPPDPDPKLTTRERFEEHRLNGVCGGCHKLIDPLGFGFEHYDAIGQYRESEGGHPVDARGDIESAGDLDGSYQGAIELGRKLAGSKQVRACYVKQWFRYALGRMETAADACSLQTLTHEFERSGRDVRALLLALPTTDSFRMRGNP